MSQLSSLPEREILQQEKNGEKKKAAKEGVDGSLLKSPDILL